MVFQGGAGQIYGDSYTLTSDATLPDGSTLTISEGKSLEIAKNVTLTNNSTLINNGKIFGEGTIDGTGTFITKQLMEDMITVPTDVKYTGEDLSETIKSEISPADTATILGKQFTVDATDWTLSVNKVSDLLYTATYTKGETSVRKDVNIICTHKDNSITDNVECSICGGVMINEKNFPDANFRSYVSQFDTDGDSILSADEINKVTDINVSDRNISALKGIEFFTALKSLNCSGNNLTSLDLSNNPDITNLDCTGNSITSITFANNTLPETFSHDCYYENGTCMFCGHEHIGHNFENYECAVCGAKIKIDKVNFPDAKFRSYVSDFDKDNDGILSAEEIKAVTSITIIAQHVGDLKGIEFFTSLKELYCFDNNLQTLDVSKNTALEILSCEMNDLTTLDIRKNTALKELDCGTNKITSLNLRNNTSLVELVCNDNKLESLDLSQNPNIEIVACRNNDSFKKIWFANGVPESFDHDHIEVVNEDKEATCTENGYKGGTHCSLCNKDIQPKEVITAEGHKYENGVCTVCNEEHKHTFKSGICTGCNYEHEHQPNQLLTDKGEDATCTKDGFTEQIVCVECSKIIQEKEIIPAKGHDYDENGKCRVCGIDQAISNEHIHEGNLSFDSWSDTDTTLAEDGYEWDADNLTLTLGDIYIYGELIIPVEDNVTIVIADGAKATVSEQIKWDSPWSISCPLNIKGNGTLTAKFYNTSGDGEDDVLKISGTKVISDNMSWYTRGGISLENGAELDVSNSIFTEQIKMDCTSKFTIDINTFIYSYFSVENGFADLEKYIPEGYKIDKTYGLFIIPENATVSMDENRQAHVQDENGNDITGRVTVEGFVSIDADSFPDDNFRSYVSENIDTDGNGLLSAGEIKNVTNINVSNKGIANLKGIEFFTALKNLDCYNNALTSLDLKNNIALTYLNCYYNQLTELDLSYNTALTYLDCSHNQLTELDLSNNTKLTTLWCGGNSSLTSITFADNITLKTFYHDCHNVTVAGKEPTCTETGLTEGTKCEWCQKITKAQEEISATGHTDENSDTRCDVCNDAIGVVLNEVSATLEGDIGMNYYITLPQSVISDDSAYVLFTANNKSTKIMVNDLSPEADGTYKFTYRMNAKEMNDKVAFEVYNSNDNPVDLYSASGNKSDDSTFEYSLSEYFNTLSSDTSPEKEPLVNLSKATLSYGSYVQKAFGHNVDDSADSGMDISDVTVDTLENHKMTKNGELPEGLKLSEMTLILETETTLCLYFKADDINNYSFTLDAAVTPVEISGEGLYCIKVANIAAKDLDTQHTLIINGNCTITFDALSYAYSVVKAGKNDSVCDAVKALYKYNEAANIYFQ